MRKPLKFLLTIVTMFMGLLLYAEMCHAQEGEATEDIFDRRFASFGYASNADVHTINANATVPIPAIHGGVAVGLVRTIEDGTTLADEMDSRLEGGYENDLFQTKAFVGLERSLQKGADLTKEVGIYVGSPEVSIGDHLNVEVAIGTLFEQVEYQEALGLDSENASRMLGILKASIFGLGVLTEFTPTFKFEDVEASIRPVYLLNVARNFSLRFDAQFDYTQNPVGDLGNWANRWSIGGDLEF